MENSIEEIEARATEEIKAATGGNEIQELSVKYLGRKGELTKFLRNISQLPPEERPAAGKNANILKKKLEKAFDAALEKIEAAEAEVSDAIDVSLPGRPAPVGTLHPITRITREICSIFQKLGFDVAEGPEVELDYYNFEALNIPKNHPARDMQDTFYVSDNIVLRTHTSPLQVRIMKKSAPPVRVVAPARCTDAIRTSRTRPCSIRWRGFWWMKTYPSEI